MTLTPHQANLLDALSEAQSDLWRAETKAQSDAARADVHAIRHSLFLSGYQFQEEDA